MVKQLTFILLISISTKIFAQEKQIVISGNIISDAVSVENIHILNKASNKGTITNKYGKFKIPVKVNDTLVFSGIQFYKKEVLITQQLIRSESITVKLFQKINELDEVEVKNHSLSGNLKNDAKSIKDSVSKIDSLVLDFSMVDFSEIVVNDLGDIHNQKAPDASKLTNPNIPIGGDLKAPMLMLINKIGKKRRQRKNKESLYQENVLDAPEKMIAEFGETFFTITLKIPRKKITPFIHYCKSKGIIELYLKGQKMEVINILIVESDVYIRKFKK